MAEELRDITPLLPLLERHPLALVSDIDGTLSPIVADPEAAAVTERCRELLGGLIDAGVHVALVTGRALEKAREMVGVDGAIYAANHGLDIWIDGRLETPEAVAEYVGHAQSLMREASAVVVPGVTVENKGPVVAYHYRNAADPDAARAAILSAMEAAPSARHFEVHEGRKVIELRPRLPVNKGVATEEVARRVGAQAVICIGDDVTDIDMFRAVGRLRDDGIEGATVAVRSEEASAEVEANADYIVDGVEGVERLLEELLRALRRTGP